LNLRTNFSPDSGTAEVYDAGVDALIFPTSYLASDLERVVLHELGHALTLPDAVARASMLEGLPSQIAAHVERVTGEYRDPADALRAGVLEALADAYAFVLLGRANELPNALLSELIFILNTVAEDNSRIRFYFDRHWR
jgi:hypothetical protein